MGGGSLPLPNSKGHVMEPVKSEPENTIQDSSNTKVSILDQKVKTQVDRVTLNKDESAKVNYWIRQVKDSSKGFLDLTKSDLVNFLIKSHRDELPIKEIKKIRLAHYSLIKHLNWITPQLKKALDENNHELVFALQAELRSLEIGVIKNAEASPSVLEKSDLSTTKKQRVKKSKNQSVVDKSEVTES